MYTLPYSEGMSLTQDDEKGYWGQIREVEDDNEDSIEIDPADWGGKKIEVNGAVMVGWGLEPCSVGRFKMMEIVDEEDSEEDEEDNEEEEGEVYVEMSEDIVAENANNFDMLMEESSEVNYDTDHGSSDSFGSTGSFE